MRRFLLTACLVALTAPAFAQQAPSPVTANAWATTDYRNRGISRSDNWPAVQGKLQLNHPTGVFGGVAASTVNLDLDDDAMVEAILFGGYQGNYGGMDYNAKVSYYSYPGGDNEDADYWEFIATGGYDFGPFYGSVTWAFSPDYINSSGTGLYYAGDLSAPLPYDLTAKAHLGFQFLSDEKRYAESGYADWSAGLWYNYADYDVDIGLQYIDTSLDEDECVERCGATGTLTLAKDFSW